MAEAAEETVVVVEEKKSHKVRKFFLFAASLRSSPAS